MCWNFTLTPETEREEHIEKLHEDLKMGENEFRKFRDEAIIPMIKRHNEMFPNMALFGSQTTPPPQREEKYLGTPRNAPCPCNSGKKYKRCCGR